jgi:hypothetical protein
MHITKTTSQPVTQQASTETRAPQQIPAQQLVVTASVTVIDRSGARVETNGLRQALRMIRNRYHPQPPVMQLARTHRIDERFQDLKWEITDTSLVPLDSEDPRKASYRLEHRDYTALIPGEGNAKGKTSQLGPILEAAQKIADRLANDVDVSSELPGFIALSFTPHEFLEDEEPDPDTLDDEETDEPEEPEEKPSDTSEPDDASEASTDTEEDPAWSTPEPAGESDELLDELLVDPHPDADPDAPTTGSQELVVRTRPPLHRYVPPVISRHWLMLTMAALLLVITAALILTATGYGPLASGPAHDAQPALTMIAGGEQLIT